MRIGSGLAMLLLAVTATTQLPGCAETTTPGGPAALATGTTTDPATRTAPVVPGTRSRVFIFASAGAACEPTAPPQLDMTSPPAKGDVTFVPGQQTTLVASSTGRCSGRPATGTGVYYTAREGATGTDRFTVTARAAGETMSRTFEVKIAD